VRVFDGPHNELWEVEGCPERLGGEVAWWLFGGDYGSWGARARPVFRTERVDAAIRAGRLQANGEPFALSHNSHQPANRRHTSEDATATATHGRSRESRPGIGRQRRQVAAWLAQGLIYQSIADAARQPGTDEFHTPDGDTLGVDEVDAHLAQAVARVLHGDGPQPGVRWRGVAVSFHPVDEQTVQMRLSTDDTSHVPVPVPASWTSVESRDRIRATIAEHIAAAHSRATDLIAAARSLADRIHPPERPTGSSTLPPTTATLGQGNAATPAPSTARVAFPRPPQPHTDPTHNRCPTQPWRRLDRQRCGATTDEHHCGQSRNNQPASPQGADDRPGGLPPTHTTTVPDVAVSRVAWPWLRAATVGPAA
jgi:hypothetical protein